MQVAVSGESSAGNAAAVRTAPVGRDRLGRNYYRCGDSARLLVEEGRADGGAEEPGGVRLCAYHTRAQMDQLQRFLDLDDADDRALARCLEGSSAHATSLS